MYSVIKSPSIHSISLLGFKSNLLFLSNIKIETADKLVHGLVVLLTESILQFCIFTLSYNIWSSDTGEDFFPLSEIVCAVYFQNCFFQPSLPRACYPCVITVYILKSISVPVNTLALHNKGLVYYIRSKYKAFLKWSIMTFLTRCISHSELKPS